MSDDPPDKAMAKHDMAQMMYHPRTIPWKGYRIYDYVTHDVTYSLPCDHAWENTAPDGEGPIFCRKCGIDIVYT